MIRQNSGRRRSRKSYGRRGGSGRSEGRSGVADGVAVGFENHGMGVAQGRDQGLTKDQGTKD